MRDNFWFDFWFKKHCAVRGRMPLHTQPTRRSFWLERNLQCLSLTEYTSVQSPSSVPILGLIISFSLHSLLQEFTTAVGARQQKICLRACNRWVGGELGGSRTTIFGVAIHSWEVSHQLLDLVPAFPGCFSSRKMSPPIGRGEGGMDFVQMSEIPLIRLPRCLYL